MKKTIFVIGLIFLIVSITIIPAYGHLDNNSFKKPKNRSIFGFNSYLYISWPGNATGEPISPGEIREVPLNITYGFTRGVFGGFLFRFFEGRQMMISISIIDSPDWCNVVIKENNLIAIVSTEIQFISNELTIQLSESAPHDEIGYIKFKGVIWELKGPFGVFTFIEGFEQNFTISFITAK